MAKQKNMHKQDNLEKILIYILGHRPDEFGLYPDEGGYVKIKKLLAALHGEEGFRGVRETQIKALLNQPGDCSMFEYGEDDYLRLKPQHSSLPPETPTIGQIPKVLYFTLKPSAWPVIHQKGLSPKSGEKTVCLWSSKEQALKIGRSETSDPVLISLQTGPALKGGSIIKPYSELLWLTERIETKYLSGPPVAPVEEGVEKKKEKQPQDKIPANAGSFYLKNAEPEVHRGKKKGKYSDTPDWKNQVRKERRRHNDEFNE